MTLANYFCRSSEEKQYTVHVMVVLCIWFVQDAGTMESCMSVEAFVVHFMDTSASSVATMPIAMTGIRGRH